MRRSDSNVPSDHHLIERIRAGDEHALNELIRQYTPVLIDIAATTVGSRDVAQDIVQDVFCWVWDMRTQFDVHGSMINYLARAVRNRAYSVLRHERSQQSRAERLYVTYADTFPHANNVGESNVTSAEFQQALAAALQTLQARTRQIFLMHIDHDLSYADIAAALELTVPTVRMQMYRATKQLAKQLTEWL